MEGLPPGIQDAGILEGLRPLEQEEIGLLCPVCPSGIEGVPRATVVGGCRVCGEPLCGRHFGQHYLSNLGDKMCLLRYFDKIVPAAVRAWHDRISYQDLRVRLGLAAKPDFPSALDLFRRVDTFCENRRCPMGAARNR